MDGKTPPSDFRMSLYGLPYDQTVPDRPPIPITTRSAEPTPEQYKAYSIAQPAYVSAKSRLNQEKDLRRDSGLAASSVRDSATTVNTEDHSAGSVKSAPSVPQIRIDNHAISVPPSGRSERAWLSLKQTRSIPPSTTANHPFQGLTLDLSTGDLADDLQPEKIEFSKRGSMLLGGRKVTEPEKQVSGLLQPGLGSRRVKSNPSLRKRPAPRVLSTDEELLSHKVRSYYDTGMEYTSGSEQDSLPGQQINRQQQDNCASLEGISVKTSMSDVHSDHSAADQTPESRRGKAIEKEELELAGGLEYWRDIQTGDVDRYGFIMPRSSTMTAVNSNGMKRSLSSREPPTLQRVSTSLQLAADAPRRKLGMRRSPSNANSAKSAISGQASSRQTKARIPRPTSSQSSYQGSLSGGSSRLRQATNRLPYNRDRRFMDEAGDMLTLPYGLGNIAENGDSEIRGGVYAKKGDRTG